MGDFLCFTPDASSDEILETKKVAHNGTMFDNIKDIHVSSKGLRFEPFRRVRSLPLLTHPSQNTHSLMRFREPQQGYGSLQGGAG